jgi:hypothetical protein
MSINTLGSGASEEQLLSSPPAIRVGAAIEAEVLNGSLRSKATASCVFITGAIAYADMTAKAAAFDLRFTTTPCPK